MTNLARTIFLAIITALGAVGCEESTSPEAEIGSAQPRLAVLSPAGAIILKDLGFEQRIVARHGFDFVLDPDIPVGGDQTGLDYETLLRARPTDIILEQAALEIPARLRELAESRGWRVHTLAMLTLENVRDAIASLDRIASGSKTMTPTGRALLARFDGAITGRPDACEKLGRTLIVTWTDPVGVMGPGSFHAEMLIALGATPIPADGAPYITLDTEDVVRLDPDSIVLLMPALEAGDLTSALGPLASVELRAVLENRVVLINHPHALTPSTALIELADALVAACEKLPEKGRTP